MPNMGSIISAHNKRVLSGTRPTPEVSPTCNCRNKTDCSLNGDCRKKSVIYEATVTVQNMATRSYIGLCEIEFKTRWYNHKQSSRTNNFLIRRNYLSTWLCKDREMEPKIEWKMLRHANSYKLGSKLCQLCLAEKLAILTGDPKILLNKRSERVSKCRHKNKFICIKTNAVSFAFRPLQYVIVDA